MALLDFIMGKKQQSGYDTQILEVDPDIARTQKQARAMQRQGLVAVSEISPEGAADQARAEQAAALRAKTGGLADTRRRLQEMIARQGLQGSSLGLAKEVGLQRAGAEEMGQIKASLPERIQAIRMQRIQNQLSAAGGVLNAPGSDRTMMMTPKQQSTRQGGLMGFAPLAGAAAGYYMGGPLGGMIGMQAGSALESGVRGY